MRMRNSLALHEELAKRVARSSVHVSGVHLNGTRLLDPRTLGQLACEFRSLSKTVRRRKSCPSDSTAASGQHQSIDLFVDRQIVVEVKSCRRASAPIHKHRC